jgi:hypothetical protein
MEPQRLGCWRLDTWLTVHLVDFCQERNRSAGKACDIVFRGEVAGLFLAAALSGQKMT